MTSGSSADARPARPPAAPGCRSSTASDAQRFTQRKPGDRVFVVVRRDQKMLLIGRMRVGAVLRQHDAVDYHNQSAFEAIHPIAPNCTPRRFDRNAGGDCALARIRARREGRARLDRCVVDRFARQHPRLSFGPRSMCARLQVTVTRSRRATATGTPAIPRLPSRRRPCRSKSRRS